MRRGTQWAVVAVLSVLAFAGCTGDPADPPPTPSPTSPAASPSETPSPTPTPTTDPATVPPERPDLSEVNAETAQALAVYFLDLYAYAFATGDLTEVRALSHPECNFCASLISGVEETVAGGFTVRGGEFNASEFQTSQVSDAYFDVELTATQGASDVLDPSGAIAASYEARTLRLAVGVLHESDTWLIRGVDTTVEQ